MNLFVDRKDVRIKAVGDERRTLSIFVRKEVAIDLIPELLRKWEVRA